MAQKSYPWPGIVGGAGAGADAGRYRSYEWWAAWAAANKAGGLIVAAAGAPLRTQAAWTNIGVYYGIPNQLEVTAAGGFVAEVDTGGALVEGQLHYNDDVVPLTVPANTNYHFVLRKNYTAALYTPPGYAAGEGTVPAYTTRITWVAALVQSTDRTTYWDVPLAEYTTDGVEITDVTDTREYIEKLIHRQGYIDNWGELVTLGASYDDYIHIHRDELMQLGITPDIDMEAVYLANFNVTFPVEYAYRPLVYLTVLFGATYGASDIGVAHVDTISTTGFSGSVRVFMAGGYLTAPAGGSAAAVRVMWQARGPTT